jgi:hypothetical protein
MFVLHQGHKRNGYLIGVWGVLVVEWWVGKLSGYGAFPLQHIEKTGEEGVILIRAELSLTHIEARAMDGKEMDAMLGG